MNMNIEKGKPLNLEERKINERQVYEFLDALNIEYRRVDHSPLFTMDSYEILEKEIGARIPKNLFLANRQETQFYLLLMPGDKKFMTKDLSKQINSARLSFGNEEKLMGYLHCFSGCTSLFGLNFDKDNRVRLLIDRSLLDNESLGSHPCMNTSTVIVKTDDVIKRIIPSLFHEPTIVDL